MTGNLALLSVMSVVYVVVAVRSDTVVTRVVSTGFAVAALCSGPLTSLRRDAALWAAVCVLVATILIVLIIEVR
jgi:uncharacterized membrane protein YoaK (UPF0700 family)